MAEVSSPVNANSSTTASKRKDDIEIIKSRLSDQSFTMGRYVDPLKPREGIDPRFLPKNVDSEMEKMWLNMIKRQE